MKNFALGFLTASVLFGGALLYYRQRETPTPIVTAEAADAGAKAPTKRKRMRSATESTQAVALRPGDLRPSSEGDDLATPDVIDMTRGGPEGELDESAVDRLFRSREADLLACIEKARPSPDAAVVGKVIVKFRIQRSGAVRGVRVEAPSILLRGGLYKCVRPIVLALRFPPSGQSNVMSYPFALE